MTDTEVMTVTNSTKGHGDALCGARKRQSDGTCTQVAGWGTDHVGVGRCKLHGGNTKNQRTAALEQQVEAQAHRALAGLGVSEPVANPLLELQRLAGEIVAFKDALRGMVERLNTVRYDGPVGEQVRGEIVVYERALDRAARVLRDITALRIDERIVEIQSRVSDRQGRLVAEVIRNILADLDLTPQQQTRVGEVVPRRLRELADGGTAAVGSFESPRRISLADIDRELELLREEAAAQDRELERRGIAPPPRRYRARETDGDE